MLSEEVKSKYEVVIGLEVHAQLSTASKIFAADAVAFGGEPNTHVSSITLGHPGTLPKLNKKAIEYAIKMGLACGSEINRYTYFDRKNYFYPDLPKGYQISQDKAPICKGGSLIIQLQDGTERTIMFDHLHLEEDAGKSVHEDSATDTFLDYNRAGTPLIEMVTEPCLKSAEEAATFLSEIRKLVRYLDICDGNMEEGSLRCDVNSSVRLVGTTKLGTKVEVKNMNSMRFIQRAIEFEIERQIELIESGGTVLQETRMFDPATGETYGMRVKETMNDYRYFPDPDLAPVVISDERLAEIKAQMPALPRELYQKFQQVYGLSAYDATLLTETKEISRYFEQVCQHTTHYKTAANWLTNTIQSYLNEKNLNLDEFVISPERLAALLALIEQNKVSNSMASQKLFPLMIANPHHSPEQLAEANNLIQQSNTDLLQTLISEVLASNLPKVAEYKRGKKGLLGMFVGEVMKKSKGTADPKLTNQLVIKALEEA